MANTFGSSCITVGLCDTDSGVKRCKQTHSYARSLMLYSFAAQIAFQDTESDFCRRGYPLIHHVHVLLRPVCTRFCVPFVHVFGKGRGVRSVDWGSVMASLGELAMG